MGDAHVAVADDASAFYWNPAGLALRPEADEIHWATARHGSSDVPFTELDVLLRVVGSRDIASGAFDVLDELADDRIFVEASGMAGYRTGRWAFGAFAQALAASDIVKESEDRINLSSWGMDATTVGVAYADSFNETLHWGVQAGKLFAGRGFARGDVLREDNGDATNTVSKNTEHAESWTASAGLMWEADDQFRVGLVGRNMLAPTLYFPQMDAVDYGPSMDLGFAWIDEEQGLIVSADLHNVTHSSGVGCHCMAGVEKQFSPDFFARAGVNETSVFSGVGLMAGSIAVDASFGVDPEERLMLTIRSPL